MAAAESPTVEQREVWTRDAAVLFLPLADPRARVVWGLASFGPVLVLAPPLVWLLVEITRWGNVGFIWLIAATTFVGFAGVTLSLAVWLEPRDVRLEITSAAIGLDEARIPVDAVAAVRWDGARLVFETRDGTSVRSRPVQPCHPDRVLELVQPGGTVVALPARRSGSGSC